MFEPIDTDLVGLSGKTEKQVPGKLREHSCQSSKNSGTADQGTRSSIAAEGSHFFFFFTPTLARTPPCLRIKQGKAFQLHCRARV